MKTDLNGLRIMEMPSEIHENLRHPFRDIIGVGLDTCTQS